MTPGNRNLGYLITKFASDEQDLDVETKSLDSLKTEHSARTVIREALQPALRVLDTRNCKYLDERVEDSAHEVTVIRLADSLSPPASRDAMTTS